jgi:hypothetical protein
VAVNTTDPDENTVSAPADWPTVNEYVNPNAVRGM